VAQNRRGSTEIELAKASQIGCTPCKLFCCVAWTVMLNIAGEAARDDDGSTSKSFNCPFQAHFFLSEWRRATNMVIAILSQILLSLTTKILLFRIGTDQID
jgi:hypothetical protein